MFERFQSQIHVVALNIDIDIFFEAWSILFPADQLFAFINSKMTYKKVIMMPIDKLKADGF